MNALTIADVGIRQDAEGRYCLNDLYRASGSANRHRPSLWLENKQTKALIAELISEQEFRLRSKVSKQEFLLRTETSEQEFLLAPVVTEAVRNPSTYVVKELVYAYAMWISPAFQLKVIRAYDALVTGQLAERDQDIAYLRGRIAAHQNRYFDKFPERLTIRYMAMKGEPYWYIGRLVSRSVSAVGRAVAHMLQWGMMSREALLDGRVGKSALSVLRRKQNNQLPLPGM